MLKALSVKQFNEYLKTTIRHDPILSKVYIKGELANVKINHNHLYFSLKEDNNIIDCVIYYYEEKDIDINFTSGVDVMVRGVLNLNNFSSRIVIAVNEVTEIGLSNEYLKFLKMKEEFRNLGYFDIENKKPIPDFPKNIGLITSKDGAAIIDFLAVINQVPNDINIKLAPVKVQGNESISLIIDAINSLDNKNLDAIVITRGGGSNEDLSVFNDGDIIKAVFDANTPIISAIGHKIDSTLLDLVADFSLQTPTEAGSYIIRNYVDLDKEIIKILSQMEDIIKNEIRIRELELSASLRSITSYNPKLYIEDKARNLKTIKKDIDRAMDNAISYQSNRINILAERLKHEKKLIDIRKENIIIKDNKGKQIFSRYTAKNGDVLEIVFSDGSIRAEVVDG